MMISGYRSVSETLYLHDWNDTSPPPRHLSSHLHYSATAPCLWPVGPPHTHSFQFSVYEVYENANSRRARKRNHVPFYDPP